jgi:hypothetical protein
MNLRRLFILGLCLAAISTRAAQLAVGDAVPALSLKDQHGKQFDFTNGVRFLLVVMDMGSAKAANKKLAEQGAGFLEKNGAAYLMDIHSMPGIARVFALPKMRKYPERIALVEYEKTLAAFPSKPERVTVLALTPEGRIRKISYWDPAAEPVAGYLQ